MNYKYILTAILIVAVFSGTASAAWANASYTYAKDITLHGADTQLSNYPYLVSVAKEPGMQADYDDLIFYDQPVSQDGNLIDFEIETYNSTTATVWLNITTLPTAGKTISMYYGNPSASFTQNPTAVWDGDYVGVWHLADGTSSSGTVWNDYKQPDGVLNVSDSTNYSTNYHAIQEANVYYTGGEFKMWANCDFNMTYWNSSDGYNWVFQGVVRMPNGTNIKAGHAFVMLDPNSPGGYLMYNHHDPGPADTVRLWSSSGNEILFTEVKANCINGSDIGVTHIGNMFVWMENASDWYMILEGNNPAWTSTYATSPNGQDWTFHGGVVADGLGSNFVGGPEVWKNNGTYYMLFHAAMSGTTPTDIYVATSTDRQNWTYDPHHNITRQYTWEGCSSNEGQVADPCLVEYNNEVYIYYEGIPNQDSPFISRLGLVHLNQSLAEVSNEISASDTTPDIVDSTANNNGGSNFGGISTGGIIGDAVNFSSSYISINTTDFYNIGTISWWSNVTSLSVERLVFTGLDDTDNDNRAQFGIVTDGNASLYARDSTFIYSNLRTDANTISTNKCQQVTWTSNGSYSKCFVDGIEVSPVSVHEGANDGTWFSDIPNINTYDIGTNGGASPLYFAGMIDEVELSKSVRSDDWINLSHQMVVNDSYVTFGAEETNDGGENTIVLGANKYGMLRKSVTSSQTFSTIASEFSHDICFTWWDSTNDRWESYYSGDSYNSAKSVPEHDSYFVLMDGTGEIVSCSVASAENVDIPIGWSSTYLRESTSKTLSAIKTDMGGNCADVYAWDSTASGTGAWTNTGTFSVSPNQGILVDASSGFTWDGSVS